MRFVRDYLVQKCRKPDFINICIIAHFFVIYTENEFDWLKVVAIS